MENVTVLLDNLRSAHNVGAILRNCAAFGVKYVVAIGATPYPQQPDDQRLPHIARRNHEAIAKTALGAERHISIEHHQDASSYLDHATDPLVALEQTPASRPLTEFRSYPPFVLIVGNEVNGVDTVLLQQCQQVIHIPHNSLKESLNVSVATGIALYHCYSQH